MGDRLATLVTHGPKSGGAAVLLSVGETGPHLTQCRLSRGLPPYQMALPFGTDRPHLDPFRHLATTDMGCKLGACTFFGGGEAGSPTNTMWPGPRPTSVPSGILIHPAVWPQQTWAENGGALCPFGGLGPHLTYCRLGRVLPPYQVVSGILIHPAVWPQPQQT